MAVREARHPRGSVFFVGSDGVEVVLIGGRLSEYLLKARASGDDVGYVREGFPDYVGEMVGDHEVRDVGSEYGTGGEGGVPICIFMM